MKLVIPDHIPLNETTIAKLQAMGAKLYDDLPEEDAAIITRIQDAAIVTFNWMKLNHAVLDAAPKLKFAISASVGYNGIDSEYAAKKGITVLNCPTQNSEAVAEHAVGLMLALARKLVVGNMALRSGSWDGADTLGTELGHKKLGLIGYGHVGKLIEHKVRGFDMIVRSVNSTSSDEELDALLKESDIVCLCLSLNDATRHIIDRRRLSLLRPHALLINVARGAVVDQAALFDLLKNGGIGGAGLDVFEDEPTSGVVPAGIAQLVNLSNVIATPHIAYNTIETIDRLGVELVKNIESCIAGQPINVVNG